MKGKKTGGRVAGTPNRSTSEIKAVAQTYTAEAMATLAAIMRKTSAPESSRVAAIREILDRGHGKSAQPLEHSGNVTMTHEQALTELESDDPTGETATLPT